MWLRQWKKKRIKPVDDVKCFASCVCFLYYCLCLAASSFCTRKECSNIATFSVLLLFRGACLPYYFYYLMFCLKGWLPVCSAFVGETAESLLTVVLTDQVLRFGSEWISFIFIYFFFIYLSSSKRASRMEWIRLTTSSPLGSSLFPLFLAPSNLVVTGVV